MNCRSYARQSTEKEGYSSNFFPRNEEQLREVIKKASQWIADKMDNAEEVIVDAA
jgi:hypothetical protein